MALRRLPPHTHTRTHAHIHTGTHVHTHTLTVAVQSYPKCPGCAPLLPAQRKPPRLESYYKRCPAAASTGTAPLLNSSQSASKRDGETKEAWAAVRPQKRAARPSHTSCRPEATFRRTSIRGCRERWAKQRHSACCRGCLLARISVTAEDTMAWRDGLAYPLP